MRIRNEEKTNDYISIELKNGKYTVNIFPRLDYSRPYKDQFQFLTSQTTKIFTIVNHILFQNLGFPKQMDPAIYPDFVIWKDNIKSEGIPEDYKKLYEFATY